jgi:hypothetical protein
MEWDLNELECITQARLMVASPEFVYAQLRYYGEKIERYAGKKDLETSLLTRRDKLIDLALARYATDIHVVLELYNRSNMISEPMSKMMFNLFKNVDTTLDSATITTDDQEANYNLAVRVACLSNRHIGYYYVVNNLDNLINKLSLSALMANRNPIQQYAILTNPSVPRSLLEALYRKTDCFAQVSELEWVNLVAISASNPLLNFLPESDDRWSGVTELYNAIFSLLETAPTTERSLRVVRSLLDALNPVLCHRTSGDIWYVIERWRDASFDDASKPPNGLAKLTLN